MFPIRRFAVLVTILLAEVAGGQAAFGQSKPRADAEGFPLPAEALARLGSARLRANGDIAELTYSPDGKVIVTTAHVFAARLPWSIQFWAAETGQLLRTIELKGSGFNFAVRYRPDGKTLCAFSGGILLEIDTETGKELRSFKLPHTRHPSGWFSPRGDLLALEQAAGDIGVFELGKGKEVTRLKPGATDDPDSRKSHNPPMAFTPDGSLLATRSRANTVEIFETATGARRGKLETPLKEPIDTIQFSPDSRHLLIHARPESWVLVRDWAGKSKMIRLGRLVHNPSWAGFAPGSLHVAVGDDDDFVSLYDAATGDIIRRFPTGGCLNRVAFSPDGKRLLAGNWNGAIGQWDVESGKPVGAAADPLAGLHVVRFLAGGKHLLITKDRHEVIEWQTGRVVHRYAPMDSRWSSQSLSHDGTMLVAPIDSGLALLEAKTGKELRRIGGKKDPVPHAHLISPDGKYLFTYLGGAGDRNRLWKLPTLDLAHVLEIGFSSMAAFSPDGKRLATAQHGYSGAGPVTLWDVASGRSLRAIQPRLGAAYAVAFLPDGNHLAIATGLPHQGNRIEIEIVDVRTGKDTGVVTQLDSGVRHLHCSPDRRNLVALEINAPTTGRLRLFEVATGKERHAFQGHTNWLGSACFSDDGALLATSSNEAPAYVWDVYGKFVSKPVAEHWSAMDQARVRQDMSSPDARAAFQAIRRMIGNPGAGVGLLRQVLRPAEAADAKQVQRLLTQLDGDEFEARQAATAELETLGYRAEVQLKEFLSHGKPSLEARRRIEVILAKLDVATPDRIRSWRALEALEQIATPDAIQLLDAISGGQPGARLTCEAAEVLERIRKRE